MEFALGSISRKRLDGVHPRLVAVIELAIRLSAHDFTVLEGVRTPARQAELYAQGRTKPGKIVTWVKVSNHFPNERTGYGHAVDLLPYPADWEGPVKFPKFDAIALAMFRAASQLGDKIRWGADWDCDGKAHEKGETDCGHFELIAW